MIRSYDLSLVYTFAKIHPSEEPELIKWFANLKAEARAHLLENSNEIFQQWPLRKSISKDSFGELRYASFLKSLKKEKLKEDNQHRKSGFDKNETPEGSNLKKDILMSLKAPKKEQQKRRLIRLKAYPAIKEMREMSPAKSWRDISEYIRRVYKKKISHVYIKKVYEEIES